MSTYDLNGRQRVEVLTIDQWARIAGVYIPEDQAQEHRQDGLIQFLTDNGQIVLPAEVVTVVYHSDEDSLPVQLTWGV
jgi:hypothetical protein